MYRLTVQSFTGQPTEHLMEGDEALIGRSTGADITLPSKFTSRRHARLFLDNGVLHVEDLGSHNGTRLDGSSVEVPTAVENGSVLEIAHCLITIEEIGVPPAFVSSALSRSSASLSGSARIL